MPSSVPYVVADGDDDDNYSFVSSYSFPSSTSVLLLLVLFIMSTLRMHRLLLLLPRSEELQHRTARGLQYLGPIITLRFQYGLQIQYNGS